MYLYRSTKSESRPHHKHLLYIKQLEDGSFKTLSSTVQGHSHTIEVDENGIINILPAGKTLHTHELEEKLEFEVENDDSDLNETEKKTKFRKLIEEAKELEKEAFEKGQESEDFYAGKQWSETDKQILASEERPAITINEVASKIDLLCGFQRQNRTDIRFFPIEGGDNLVSDIGTQVIKNILDTNSIQVQESEVFRDESAIGRGLYHSYVDFNINAFGKIVVEKLAWNSVNFGPHEKYDLSDCEYLVKHAVVPKKKLKLMFPDKKEEIDNLYKRAETIEFSKRNRSIEGFEYRANENNINLTEVVNVDKQMITVTEVWEKNYITTNSVVNYEDAYVETFNELKKEEVKGLEEMGFEVIRRTMHNMKVTTIAGDIILDEKIEDQDFFPILPVYAKRTSKGMFYGKIEDVKDIQREINKRHSQSLDVVNRVSSYGYFYDDQTFESTREENQWRKDSSKAGFTAKVKDLSKIPHQTQGIKMPTELTSMMELASQKLMSVMNISPEALGFSEREVSSVAIIEKRRNVLTANEFLYDNLAQVKKALAKNILKMVQKTYSVDRVMRIIANQHPQTEEDLIKIQQQQEATRILLEETDLSDLDVAIEISANSPTLRSANFSLLLEMLRNGAPIPPEVIIESSDLPNKEKILGIITGQQQATAESERAKNDTEIRKTLYSKLEPSQAQQIMMGQSQLGAPQQ